MRNYLFFLALVCFINAYGLRAADDTENEAETGIWDWVSSWFGGDEEPAPSPKPTERHCPYKNGVLTYADPHGDGCLNKCNIWKLLRVGERCFCDKAWKKQICSKNQYCYEGLSSLDPTCHDKPMMPTCTPGFWTDKICKCGSQKCNANQWCSRGQCLNSAPTSEVAVGSFPIFVKQLNGKIITLPVHTGNTINEIKKMIFVQAGIPENQQGLIFGGAQLQGSRTVADYNIKQENTLHLVLRAQVRDDEAVGNSGVANLFHMNIYFVLFLVLVTMTGYGFGTYHRKRKENSYTALDGENYNTIEMVQE